MSTDTLSTAKLKEVMKGIITLLVMPHYIICYASLHYLLCFITLFVMLRYMKNVMQTYGKPKEQQPTVGCRLCDYADSLQPFDKIKH